MPLWALRKEMRLHLFGIRRWVQTGRGTPPARVGGFRSFLALPLAFVVALTLPVTSLSRPCHIAWTCTANPSPTLRRLARTPSLRLNAKHLSLPVFPSRPAGQADLGALDLPARLSRSGLSQLCAPGRDTRTLVTPEPPPQPISRVPVDPLCQWSVDCSGTVTCMAWSPSRRRGQGIAPVPLSSSSPPKRTFLVDRPKFDEKLPHGPETPFSLHPWAWMDDQVLGMFPAWIEACKPDHGPASGHVGASALRACDY